MSGATVTDEGRREVARRLRKVKAWLVTEYTDWVDSVVHRPVTAFQRREMAERCKEARDRRAEGAEDLTWHEVYEIEVVLDD